MQYFFINQNGQQSGPVAPEAFKINGIKGNTMVWCEGMGNWQEAQTVPELRKFFKSSFLNLPILIVYVVVMTIVLSLLSIPVTGLIASAFDTYAYYIPIPVVVLSVLTMMFFLMKRFRHQLRNAFFLTLPFLISAVVSIIYFTNTSRFDTGYCRVYKNGNMGLMNKFGFAQLPCVYDYLSPIDKEGHDVGYWHGDLPFRFIAKKDHYGLINFSGEEILPFKYDELNIWREGETNTPLLLAEKEDFHGIFTLDGETVLKCEYSYICKKNETTGCSKINIGGSEDSDNDISGGKWGLIDKNAQLIVPCEYESISTYFSSGYIKASKDYKTDYYDFDGKLLKSEYEEN